MSWNYYHEKVVATVGTTTYDIPVGNLVLVNEPVSKAGSFAIELFNSARIQRVDGWFVKANFSYDELTGAANETIRLFIEMLLDEGVCTVDFDPLDEFPAENRTVEMILMEGQGVIQANFNERARSRTSTFSLISRRQLTEPLEWIIL